MRWIFPVVVLAAGAFAAEDKPAAPEPKQPVTDNKQLPRHLVKPWVAAGFVEYAGVYTALKGDDPGNSRLVFTPFVSIGGDEMLSVLRVSIPDLMAEPIYTMLGSVACDPKTGNVKGFGTSNKWRMVTYADPNTSNPVYGVEVDGLIYADWNHAIPGAKPVAPVKTPQQSGAPPPGATPIPAGGDVKKAVATEKTPKAE
ncbi:hypothetical protein [Luteolibacter sp. LG18]|uniref:hypothetical protein n=1 Tax=Luteolibacter sp. LG18 TaxID=2819286 RepID=UPI002B2CE3AF|nr:hypothetical protein llg_37940 [Luteolibacter sp. LG18]